MHISDGVLSAPVWSGGYAFAAFICGLTMRKMNSEQMPEVAVMTSAFFVGSLIHIPVGPTSIHLLLNGLTGIILGPLSFLAVFLAITLQTFLFQHGGITTIGVNSVLMGLPALVCWKIYDLNGLFGFAHATIFFAVLAGIMGPLLSGVLLGVFLTGSGPSFLKLVPYVLISHIPVVIAEGTISGFIVSFLLKIKPEIIERSRF